MDYVGVNPCALCDIQKVENMSKNVKELVREKRWDELAEEWRLSGGSVHDVDRKGYDLAWYAGVDGRWEDAKKLMALGAKPERVLEGAVVGRNTNGPEWDAVVEAVADVNVRMAKGRTMLHWACRRGDLDWARKLLDRGADPNAMSNDGRSPFNDLLWRFDAELAEALMRRGLDLSKRDFHGNGVAHAAVFFGSSKALSWIARRQSEALMVKNHKQETPLVMAARLPDREKCVNVLVKAKVNVNDTDARGRSALFWAVARGRAGMAEFLMKNGADPELRSGKRGHGASALKLAQREKSGIHRVLLIPAMEKAGLAEAAKPGAAVVEKKKTRL